MGIFQAETLGGCHFFSGDLSDLGSGGVYTLQASASSELQEGSLYGYTHIGCRQVLTLQSDNYKQLCGGSYIYLLLSLMGHLIISLLDSIDSFISFCMDTYLIYILAQK